MANRYNELLDSQKYVETYVPLPLSIINQAGAAKQKAHDKTLSDLDAVKDLLAVKADPNRYGDRDELLKSYTGAIDQLADDYIKSDNSAEVANKLYKLKRSWSNDPIRMGLESSAANYDSYLKEKRENMKSGKSDFTIKGGYDTYAEDQTRDENGNFKPFVHEGLWTAEDLDTKAKAVMGTIAKDGSDFNGAQKNKDGSLALNPNGSYWSVKSGGSGVKKSKAENLAIIKSEAFISDPKEGRYFIDKLLGQHVPYSQLDTKTKDYVQQEAAKYLYQSAANQIGWETKSGNDLNWIPEDLRNPKEEKSTPESGTMVAGAINSDGLKSLFGNVKPVDLIKQGSANFVTSQLVPGLSYFNGKYEVDISKLDGTPGAWSKFYDATINAGIPGTQLNGKASGQSMDEKQLKKQLINIGVRNGWIPVNQTSTTLSSEQMETQMLEKVAKNLVYLSVSSQDNYKPPTSISNSALIKKQNTLSSNDGKGVTLESYLADLTTDQARNSTNITFDFSGKSPRMQVLKPGGDEYKSFNITDRSISSALAPIGDIVSTNRNVIYGNENPTSETTKDAYASMIAFRQSGGNVDVNNYRPLSRKQDKHGNIINSYSDVNKPGSVFMIMEKIDSNGNVDRIPMAESKYIQITTDYIFNSPEMHDALGTKNNKQTVGQ